jgi:guanylate kinase
MWCILTVRFANTHPSRLLNSIIMTSKTTHRPGLLFILIGPSGAGKNTLLKRVLERLDGFQQMPTATTRPRRADELEGVHHFFFSEEEFDRQLASGAFVEWQRVHSWRYGTLKATAERGFENGKMYIADIEVLGAKQLDQLYPENVILIFVTPSPPDIPNLLVLEHRIRQRGDIPDAEIHVRLARARMEFKYRDMCDHILINDDLDHAITDLAQFIMSHDPRSLR